MTLGVSSKLGDLGCYFASNGRSFPCCLFNNSLGFKLGFADKFVGFTASNIQGTLTLAVCFCYQRLVVSVCFVLFGFNFFVDAAKDPDFLTLGVGDQPGCLILGRSQNNCGLISKTRVGGGLAFFQFEVLGLDFKLGLLELFHQLSVLCRKSKNVSIEVQNRLINRRFGVATQGGREGGVFN